MPNTIKLRRGTAAQWTAANPVLAAGEPGFETDTGKHKIGDGASAWSALDYFLPQAEVDSLIAATAVPQHSDRVTIPTLAYATGVNPGAANRAWFTRMHVTERCAIYGTTIYVNTQSGNVCVGLYAADGPGGLPGTRLATSGSVPCPAGAGSRTIEFTAAVVLDPGTYWSAFSADNNTVAFFASASNGQPWDTLDVGISAQAESAFPLPATIPQRIYSSSARQVGGLMPRTAVLGDIPLGGVGGLYPFRVGEYLDGYNSTLGAYVQEAVSAYAFGDRQPVAGGCTTAMEFEAYGHYETADQLPQWTADEVKHGGLTFATTDVNNNYVAMVSVMSNQFQLVKQVAGVETVLAKRALPSGVTLSYGTRYIIEGTCDGTNVTATLKTVAGTVLDTVTVADSTWKNGLVGPHVYSLKMRTYGLTVTA